MQLKNKRTYSVGKIKKEMRPGNSLAKLSLASLRGKLDDFLDDFSGACQSNPLSIPTFTGFPTVRECEYFLLVLLI